MFGFQMSISMTFGSTSTTQTGITVSVNDIPMKGTDPTQYSDWEQSIVNYTFLLFYLPPPSDNPNLWAQELAAANSLDPAWTVDEGSQPWKILFIVSQYQTGADSLRGVVTYDNTEFFTGQPSAPAPRPSSSS